MFISLKFESAPSNPLLQHGGGGVMEGGGVVGGVYLYINPNSN